MDDCDTTLTKHAVTHRMSPRTDLCLFATSLLPLTSHVLSSHTPHCIRSLRCANLSNRWWRSMLSHAVEYHKCKRRSLTHTTRSILTTDTLSTARNSTESPLLRLPGEFRNRIFAHVLGGYTIVMYRKRSDTSPGRYDGLKLKLSLTTTIEPYFADSPPIFSPSQVR